LRGQYIEVRFGGSADQALLFGLELCFRLSNFVIGLIELHPMVPMKHRLFQINTQFAVPVMLQCGSQKAGTFQAIAAAVGAEGKIRQHLRDALRLDLGGSKLIDIRAFKLRVIGFR